MSTNPLDQLNPNQREAVESINGPLLILAGPGSGKTRVITERIAYLVRVCGVTPYRIGAVTFTNRAAREMRYRLAPMLGSSARDLTASTFHAFCAQILRRDGHHLGLDRDFVIYDDADQVALMKRAMGAANIDVKTFSPRALLSAISAAKSQLVTVDGFALRRETYFDEIVHRAYEQYEGLLSQASAVDFDDLLLKAHFLFEQFPDVAAGYQNRYIHFMIDEFQDTNIVQYAVAKQIAEKHRNLCVVGDPDQSIYSWRNADIRNILSFQTDYPEAKVVNLAESYRSTQTILDAAQGLIVANEQRVEKDLWTHNGRGVPIVVSEEYNEQEEAQSVVREVQTLVRQDGYAAGDIAVMYRVNAQSRALEEACLRFGVPYQLIGSVRFYQRQEIKDVTAYLRLITNPNDDVSLARVVNVPARGIGQRTVDELTRLARDSGVSMYAAIEQIGQGDQRDQEGQKISATFAPRSAQALTDFRGLIERLTADSEKLDLAELIGVVIERTGYIHYAEEMDRGEDRLENLQELRSTAKEFAYLGHREGLQAFLESVSLVSDLDEMQEKPDAITLITLHQAKGLEFPVVFIVGMEEGLLPHSRSIDDPAELEEERRLCYVGVTRAKQRLYLHRAFRRGFRGGSEPSAPSRFLADIPSKLIVAPERTSPKVRRRADGPRPSPRVRPVASSTDRRPNPPGAPNGGAPRPAPDTARQASPAISLATGDKVRHATFGEGIVMSCAPSRTDIEVTVAFTDGGGVKRLLLSFAPLEKVE